MRINLDTMKTVGYVVKNRLKGYKLLENPNGTSFNSVTMIKSFYEITDCYLDQLFINKRIHRQKVNDNFVEDKRETFAKYLTDPKTKAPSGKKNLLVYIEKDGQKLYAEKEVFSEFELSGREKPEWKNEEEKRNLIESLKEKHKSFYFPHASGLAKFLTFGFWKKMTDYDGRPMGKSFFSILISNLNNSPKI